MAGPWSRPAPWSSPTLHPALPPQQSAEYQVEIGGEIRLACGRGPGIGAYHKQATSRKRPQIPAGQMTEPPPDPVPHHRRAHRPAHDESDPGRLIPARPHQQMAGQQRPAGPAAAADRRGEICPMPHPRRCGKHRRSPRPRGWLRRSDTDPGAALAAPRGENGAASPGAHAQPEPVRLRAAAVVRLERTLAHWGSRYGGRIVRSDTRASRAPEPVSAQADASPAGGRTNARYARRAAPPVKPAAGGRPCPVALVRIPLAPQHFPFAERAPEPGPRLWTEVRPRGAGTQRGRRGLAPGGGGAAAEPETTCTTCGKTC